MSGIYIHILFASRHVTICDFHFFDNIGGKKEAMILQLIKELELRKEEI